jgi:RNA 2',3'-cyclic 3'-phosphodiesterase
MRMFISIGITEDVRRACMDMISRLMGSGADLRTIDPDNLHMTLKFLGEVREDGVKDISERIRKVAFAEPPFTLGISMLGYFGSTRFPRTVWAGVSDGRDRLISISKALNNELSHIRNEEKEPRPHLTLARVKTVRNAEKLVDTIRSNRNVKFGEVYVKEILLMRSQLTPTGPIYSELERFALSGQGRGDRVDGHE